MSSSASASPKSSVLPQPAITLHNVSKRYHRPHDALRATTLKSFLTRDMWHAWFSREAAAKRAAAAKRDAASDNAIWALRHIDLALTPGRTTGIIGKNGSGKSTLLKLFGRIIAPDEGQVQVQGRVAALIELGAGFHPELTGRENVFINGIILGLTKAEVRARMAGIIAFADIGAFIDYPVRTYSSGMYARLGFAVAIHVEPDILLVDEVLSVGDGTFTHRCRQALDDFRARGKSIVVVSHDLQTIANWCEDAVWIDAGTVRHKGPAADVVRAYKEALPPEIS